MTRARLDKEREAEQALEAKLSERSRWVCNIHGFHVERCFRWAKAVQEAK